MHERFLDKNTPPTKDEYLLHIGSAVGLFEKIDEFITTELNAEKKLGFSAHDRCWSLEYHIKRRYVCSIYLEKDSFTLVTRLSEDYLNNVYDNASPYTKKCIDNSPFRHRGWIECRIFDDEHLDDAKMMLQVRADYK